MVPHPRAFAIVALVAGLAALIAYAGQPRSEDDLALERASADLPRS